MKSTIRLFKAVPIITQKKTKSNRKLFKKTIPKRFIFSPEVIGNYSEHELDSLIKIVEKELTLTSDQMNNAFHKSWKKIKDASIEELVIEQIIHYITTYGFERIGIYDKNTVYIPDEKLKTPQLKVEGINLIIIKGYTKNELKNKLLNLLNSGIALKDETKDDIIDIATYVELTEHEITQIKNKEVRTALYDYLDLFPENPIEFLRYLIYKSTNKTLLIKDSLTIKEIKSKDNLYILNLLKKYKNKYGLEKLAEIFYRFKPLFLAFRTNKQLKTIINKLRKLAVKYHKPMQEDYLNNITNKIKNKKIIDKNKLQEELQKVNPFRKIRLAYALKYRTQTSESILYKIRNGKGYATEFKFNQQKIAEKILNIVRNSLVEDIKKNVNKKKIYIPDYINYALPATEKQFIGNFPSGTYVSIPKDMIVGVHWNNLKDYRIDLDLSLISDNARKIGWDSMYRTEDRDILFSGDITDAPLPKGASELFYVQKQKEKAFILFLNYYNYNKEEVPFKIMVAKEQPRGFNANYMINPNNIIAITESKITQPQKILGLLIITEKECRFYFTETYLGQSITSYNNKFIKNATNYLFNFYQNTINLNEILEKSGAKIVDSKEKCDIDLSPEKLEKDTILNLISA